MRGGQGGDTVTVSGLTLPTRTPAHLQKPSSKHREPSELGGCHALRHTAAQTWLEAGVHIKAVSDLLGHSSIAITGDIYGHTSDDTARAAMDSLVERLGHGKPNLTVVSDPDETGTAAPS